MENSLNKVKTSFIKSTKGLESFSVITWYWGAIAFFLAYFIFDKVVRKFNQSFFVYPLSVFFIIYFVWHIYATIKCAPKRPKLTKEEKEKLKIQNGGTSKVFFRKLFLQESITELNSRNILVAIDLFLILHFYSNFG
jgi:hypothetical protein